MPTTRSRDPYTTVTDYLFAMPRPLFGAARLLDLAAEFDLYNIAATPEEADTLALMADWCMVGQDLRDAIIRLAPPPDHHPAIS